jgi:hypothetical protein
MRLGVGLGYLVATMLAVAGPIEARADASCTFSVANLSLAGDGTLGATFTAVAPSLQQAGSPSASWQWVICSLVNSTPANTGAASITITPETCRTLHAHLVAARTHSGQITLNFVGVSECSQASLPPSGGALTLFPTSFNF